MATGKKSFVLYSDMLQSIDHLTNEEKGILFNHLLEYVNDLEPILTDRLILTAWKPIELSLKRDLVKFKEVKAKRSNAGKLSAELRAFKKEEQTLTNSTSVESVVQTSTNSTDSVNDNDNDNVNVSVNDILLKKETKEYKPTFEDFKIYALEKEPTVSLSALKNKYDAWEANDWRNGNDKPIKNWKSALLQTMPYIEKIKKVAPDGYYYDKQGILKRRIS
jgi:hypothetical protein